MNTKKKEFNTWSEIDWQIVDREVRKMQYRIYDATRFGETKKIYVTQKRFIYTIWAKLHAVRLVTTLNESRNNALPPHPRIAGVRKGSVDRIIVTSDKQKLELAKSLKLDGRSLPIRRVTIDKAGEKEKRPLGISMIEDRAKQALAKLSLEPEWEARFEPSSYGFRPGRSCHDAIEKTFTTMDKGVLKWVYDADMQRSFDKINNDALLDKINTYPEMKRQIRAWLKSGIMEGYRYTPKEDVVTPTERSVSQGQVISPLLANIALHGLENEMKDFVTTMKGPPFPGSTNRKTARKNAVTVIRYADHFIVIHRNREILKRCIERIKEWLLKIGLKMNEEKSVLRDGRKGFDFLGFRIIQVKRKMSLYKIKIYPQKTAQLSILRKTREVIIKHRASSSYRLIELLAPKIIGWANYYSSCQCKLTFSKLTNQIFNQIRAWVFRRDRRHGRLIVKPKYFPEEKTYLFDGREYKDNWVLVGTEKDKGGATKHNFLPHMKWVKSRKHGMVKGDASPFDKDLAFYWAVRSEKQS